MRPFINFVNTIRVSSGKKLAAFQLKNMVENISSLSAKNDYISFFYFNFIIIN